MTLFIVGLLIGGLVGCLTTVLLRTGHDDDLLTVIATYNAASDKFITHAQSVDACDANGVPEQTYKELKHARELAKEVCGG